MPRTPNVKASITPTTKTFECNADSNLIRQRTFSNLAMAVLQKEILFADIIAFVEAINEFDNTALVVEDMHSQNPSLKYFLRNMLL